MSTDGAEGDARRYALDQLVIAAWERGDPLNDIIFDVGAQAMARGFELTEAEEFIRHQYDLCSARQTTEQAIARLAALSAVRYERLREAEAKRLGMRVSVLDAQVAGIGRNGPNARTGSGQTLGGEGVGDRSNGCSNGGTVRTADELYASAKAIIESEDVLNCIRDAVPKLGYAGDTKPVLLVYVAVTSRLVDKPINAHVIAPSAAGKNYTINTALVLIPEEAVFQMTASSPKALIYSDEDLRHRTVILAECDSILNLVGSAATLVRSIIEDARTDYYVVEQDPETGKYIVRRVAKDGPTGLITTGIGDPEFQTSTRALNIYVSDSPEQTRAILRVEAAGATGTVESLSPDTIAQFQDFQRWLAVQPKASVIVPFAPTLAEKIPAGETRMRRDFKQLLAVIKAIALLNQHHRERDSAGRIVAALADYAWARTLLLSSFKSIVGGGITDTIRETVAAVPMEGEVSEADLVRKLNLSKSTVNYRVTRALRGGWLQNLEQRKGYAFRLIPGVPLPEDGSPLPTVEDLKNAVEHPAELNGHSNGHQTTGAVGENKEAAFDGSTHSNGIRQEREIF